MLVLTRKPGETLLLGDNIEVKVISVEGEQVKIGIEAPKSLKIYRQEVYDAIQQENKAALKNTNLSILDSWE